MPNRIEEKGLKELKAGMLLKLIQEHKLNCGTEDCGISTFLFLPVFEEIAGRKATTTEFRKFL